MYVYIYTYICTYVCVHIYICIHIYICKLLDHGSLVSFPYVLLTRSWQKNLTCHDLSSSTTTSSTSSTKPNAFPALRVHLSISQSQSWVFVQHPVKQKTHLRKQEKEHSHKPFQPSWNRLKLRCVFYFQSQRSQSGDVAPSVAQNAASGPDEPEDLVRCILQMGRRLQELGTLRDILPGGRAGWRTGLGDKIHLHTF